MHQNDEIAKRIMSNNGVPSSAREQRIAKALILIGNEQDGGAGSGNFGHGGRPGQIGGSSGKGGSGSLTSGMTQKNTETAAQFHKAVRFIEKKIDKKPAGTVVQCPYPNDPFRRKSVFVKEADGTWTQHTYAGRIPLGRTYGWTSYMVGTELVNNVQDSAEAFSARDEDEGDIIFRQDNNNKTIAINKEKGEIASGPLKGTKVGGKKRVDFSRGRGKMDLPTDSRGRKYSKPAAENVSPREIEKVGHEVNTLYHSKHKGKRMFMHITYSPDDDQAYNYRIECHGFGEYNIWKKTKNRK